MKLCDHYKNEYSCLTCPYPADALPCEENEHKIQSERDRQSLKRHWEDRTEHHRKYYAAHREEVIRKNWELRQKRSEKHARKSTPSPQG